MFGALGLDDQNDTVVETGWSRKDIVAAIKDKGFTLIGLEKQVGLGQGSVNQALCRRCPRVNRIISGLIGVSVYELWPQWFYESGEVIKNNKHHKISSEYIQKANETFRKFGNQEKKIVVDVSIPKVPTVPQAPVSFTGSNPILNRLPAAPAVATLPPGIKSVSYTHLTLPTIYPV